MGGAPPPPTPLRLFRLFAPNSIITFSMIMGGGPTPPAAFSYICFLALIESSLFQSSWRGLPPPPPNPQLRFRCLTGSSLPVFESSLLPS